MRHHWRRPWREWIHGQVKIIRRLWLTSQRQRKEIRKKSKINYHSEGTEVCTLGEPKPYMLHLGRTQVSLTHLLVVPHQPHRISIGSVNGLSPIRRQAIIWTNAGLLWIGPLGTNFSEILIKIQTFSFTKMHLKSSSAKWRPFYPGGDELRYELECYI